MAESFAITVTADTSNLSCLDLLEQSSGLSRSNIKQAIDKGALWIKKSGQGKAHTRRLRRVKTQLAIGDQLYFYYDPNVLSQSTENAELIKQFNGYSVWYKPPGMLSQGSKWSDHCTITRFVEKQQQSNAYLIHRLDRATRGLILIGESKQVSRDLAAMFRQRNLQKHYQAIVQGKVTQKQTLTQTLDGKAAVSHITPVHYNISTDTSLLSIKIDTGRKHQIRRHLRSIGHPIIGDRLYGQPQLKEQPDLQLCAYQLEFQCPVSHDLQHIVLDSDKQLKL